MGLICDRFSVKNLKCYTGPYTISKMKNKIRPILILTIKYGTVKVVTVKQLKNNDSEMRQISSSIISVGEP